MILEAPRVRGQRTWATAISRALSESKFRTEFPMFPREKKAQIQKKEGFIRTPPIHYGPSSSVSKRSAISLQSKIASEGRFPLRIKRTKVIPVAEFLAIPESASEWECASWVRTQMNSLGVRSTVSFFVECTVRKQRLNTLGMP